MSYSCVLFQDDVSRTFHTVYRPAARRTIAQLKEKKTKKTKCSKSEAITIQPIRQTRAVVNGNQNNTHTISAK